MLKEIIFLLKEATKRLKPMVYIWGVVAVIVVVALVVYFKLRWEDVGYGGLMIVGFMFLVFVFCVVARLQERWTRFLGVVLFGSVCVVVIGMVLTVGYYMIVKGGLGDRLKRQTVEHRYDSVVIPPARPAVKAASSYVIAGEVLDDGGQPLDGVQIVVPGGPQAVTTNAAGAFRLALHTMPAGHEFRLFFSKKGFVATSETYFQIPKTDIIKYLSKKDSASL